ncbi:alpha-ketoacid dehydrogenase subunit beta [Sulfurimonas autotrophica]|uniref:Transketolase central region n=1 Tax=Sulfurimonas autotrophica (strain ATCC BAA-671 / DSM 16294 / JCM 11897 / OK10) TaxID=563040 RepID=E0UPL5_SULAO|nr:alpha-ketoacid dehydrogenase subunit beta [Sulfurimonas autotrophica]ADN08607.1 Transketolase central region [Sulfurimonas autotrophica DSM 16294]
MSENITYREAVKRAIHKALKEDERVFLMGEDVGRYGGSYAVSMGFLEEFGKERIIDTPLCESGFTGAGIGAAVNGMRPIVEIMTVNFSFLALDQIVNSASALFYMSGGQFNVPLVIRMATGGGNQLGAQHSHSLEGWYAHIPGLKVLTPATIQDAYAMVGLALEDPNPVLIFENATLYNKKGDFDEKAPVLAIGKAFVHREGKDITFLAYGVNLLKALEAADILAKDGIDAEVIDLRSLRPLDNETIMASIKKTHRALIVDEDWKSGSISAEIMARINEDAFYELDAPMARVCSREVPFPYAAHLEQAAMPQVDKIVQTAHEVMES